MIRTLLLGVCGALWLCGMANRHVQAAEWTMPLPAVELKRSDAEGMLQVLIEGREAFAYRYGKQVDLPHYFPVRSPSGKLLTVQQTEPYPHHRSVWFADKIQLAGEAPVEFYMALYTRQETNDPAAPFKVQIRQAEFLPMPDSGGPEIRSRLVWEADLGRKPMLDEERTVRVLPLGGGEYLLDMTFTVTASYGDVTFRSDAVHYAWPFVRMHPQFSVSNGATLTSSEGGVNEKQTHNQVARWVDYSNTVDGQTEGLALFSHSDNEHPHRWLTRDYGTFGPRRVDAKSGQPFTLRKGETMRQRVGILVHKGDMRTGRVAERYQDYASQGRISSR
jgi:hypothetical protein